jgi:hypothetical protein
MREGPVVLEKGGKIKRSKYINEIGIQLNK